MEGKGSHMVGNKSLTSVLVIALFVVGCTGRPKNQNLEISTNQPWSNYPQQSNFNNDDPTPPVPPVDPEDDTLSDADFEELYSLIDSMLKVNSDTTTSTSDDDDDGKGVTTTASSTDVDLQNIYYQYRSSGYADNLYTLSADEESGYSSDSDEAAFQLWKSASDAVKSGCTSGVNKLYQCKQQRTYRHSSSGTWTIVNVSGYDDLQHYVKIGKCASTDTAEELDDEADNGFLGYSCKKKDFTGLYKLKSWGVQVYFAWFGAYVPGLADILNAYGLQVLKEDTDDTYDYKVDADYDMSGLTYQGSLGYVPTDL